MRSRTCSACMHQFAKLWRGWNAVDLRYERCPRCGMEDGYESDLYAWLRKRKERRARS